MPSGVVKLKKLGYKIVLFVGRITIMKGADYLIQAAKKVLEYEPKVMFVIVGSGDMEGQVMREAANLGISNKVVFPGFLRGRELSDAYRSADLFVMPSVAEPFGLTSLESLIHGTPVLISKQSGVSEVIPNALRTDFWDTDDMADKILSVLKYKSLHNELAANGARDALNCNWDNAAQKCIRIYNSLS
jgi:glycosyltransferase involved in cell wall biosynthesis